MSTQLDLEEAFQAYFHEREGFALRSERFYQDISDRQSKADLAKAMTTWLQAAFYAGAKALAEDTQNAKPKI